MGVPMVRSCCFCVSLSTGTLIIGYLYTFVSLLEVFLYSLIVTLRPVNEESGLSTHKFVYFMTAAVVSAVHMLGGILLIIGTTKNRAFLTLPWTIVTGILSAVYFILCLTGISLILQDSGAILTEEAAVIFGHLLRACVSVYCVVVVHSRHKEIMTDKNEEKFLHSARLYSPVGTDYR